MSLLSEGGALWIRAVPEYLIRAGFASAVTDAMTAYTMVGDRERCIDAGLDDYLMKPVNIDELNRVLLDVAKSLESR